MKIIKFCFAAVAAVLLLASCSVDFTGDGDANRDTNEAAPSSAPAYGDDDYYYIQYPLDESEGTLPPPMVNFTSVPEVTSINLLICEWIGWKPIIDANRGVGSRPGAGSLYERLNLSISIDVRQHIDLSAETMAYYLYTGAYNAIGMSVEQFAEVYHILYGQNFAAKMIYSPGYSSFWGNNFENSGLSVMGIVVCANLLNKPRLVNSFVMGALRATFNYTYTQDIDGNLVRSPYFRHIRGVDAHMNTSDEELLRQLRYVSFYDRRHNMMVLHTRNIAEGIFYTMWMGIHGSGLSMPNRDDLFDITPLQSVPLLAGYTFGGSIVETVYIVVHFDAYCWEIRNTAEFQRDIDAVINVLNHRSELNLNIHGFVSIPVGGRFTRQDIAQNRADSVMERLIMGGIDESRLTSIMGGALVTLEGEDRDQNRIVRIEYVR